MSLMGCNPALILAFACVFGGTASAAKHAINSTRSDNSSVLAPMDHLTMPIEGDQVTAPDAAGGVIGRKIVTFDRGSPLTDPSEAAPRELGPVAFERLRQQLLLAGKALGGQPIDVRREHFVVYVPRSRPSPGYGLVVFVPPWRDARIPLGWSTVLERQGIIFVSAAHSGNEVDILNRRVPLAVLAAENVKAIYPIDAARTYVVGFSGGSRVALRVALAYPDVFAGALLNSGSDEIGTAELPLPPAAILDRFQSSRIIYATGEHDEVNLNKDFGSRASLARFCAFNTDTIFMPYVGHELMSVEAFARGVERLGVSGHVDFQRLAQCRARLSANLNDRH